MTPTTATNNFSKLSSILLRTALMRLLSSKALRARGSKVNLLAMSTNLTLSALEPFAEVTTERLLWTVVYDLNGREASDAQPFVSLLKDLDQYIFCSSAGVYLKSDQMPHREEDSTDPKSRHKVSNPQKGIRAASVVRFAGNKAASGNTTPALSHPHKQMQGKLDTEKLLLDSGITWTSIRPVYIYGEPRLCSCTRSHVQIRTFLAWPAMTSSCIAPLCLAHLRS